MQVAIKTTSGKSAGSKMFRDEIETSMMLNLNTHYICRCYGWSMYQNSLCLVMKLYEGGTLQGKMERGGCDACMICCLGTSSSCPGCRL